MSGAFGVENLHLGCRLVNIVEQVDSVVLEFANGRTEQADVVGGADGVRSTVRRWVTGADEAVYSGTSAFRGLMPTENLPSLPDPEAIQFWMGPDAHLLHYAIGGNAEIVNFFAVVETPRIWLSEDTVTEVPEDVPVASFRGWHPAVTEMIRAAASPIRWGLFTVRPLRRWYRGRVVILGDAAHGMLPHHGQGANTSIEDAFALAALLAEGKRDDLEATFSRFQAMRPRPHPHDPAQLLGDQHPAPPARRAGVAAAQRQGGPVPGGLRLDPRVRRPAGAGAERGHPDEARARATALASTPYCPPRIVAMMP